VEMVRKGVAAACGGRDDDVREPSKRGSVWDEGVDRSPEAVKQVREENKRREEQPEEIPEEVYAGPPPRQGFFGLRGFGL
jgi:hypothetical protein